jgi:hypothetical protein
MFDEVGYRRKLKTMDIFKLKAELGMINDERLLFNDSITIIHNKLKDDISDDEISDLMKQVAQFEGESYIRDRQIEIIKYEINKRYDKTYI